MTLMRSDLQDYLVGKATISALIGTRCYPQILPQAVTYPALTYQQISAVDVRSLNGSTGRIRPRISIHSWAKTSLVANQLADAVRAAMGTMATADNVMFENQFETFEEEAEAYRVIQDFIISVVE